METLQQYLLAVVRAPVHRIAAERGGKVSRTDLSEFFTLVYGHRFAAKTTPTLPFM